MLVTGRRASELLTPAVALVLLMGCASTQVKPVGGAGYAVESDEAKLIRQADDYEARLAREGRVLRDPELQAYVAAVGVRLVPPEAGAALRFRFLVIRDASINAFALPQGSIYVNTGLLARLENEAQLAHVLGHEVTHVVERHQLRFSRSLRNKTVAAKVAQLVIVPAAGAFGGGAGADLTNLLIGLTHAATVTGYGREEERAADLRGLRAMAAASYDVTQAPRVYRLLTEFEDPGALEIFFYGSHPANRTRAAYLAEAVAAGEVAAASGATIGLEEFTARTAGAARENIRLRIVAGHPRFALDEVELYRRRRGSTAEVDVLEGDALFALATDPEQAAREGALRQRRREPERSVVERLQREVPANLARAEEAYGRAAAADPTSGLAHRGLGLVALARGVREVARQELSRYLELAPRAADRRAIERRLEEAR